MLVQPWEPPSEERVIIDTTSPTVWRRWLAREMKRLRTEVGLEQIDVAKKLRSTAAKVSYLERQERNIQERDLVEVLLPTYRVPPEMWQDYIDACERSHLKGWWVGYDEDIIPKWFTYYLGLEQGAKALSGLAMQLVPGLLQAPGYARTIMNEPSSGLSPAEAAGRTEVRLHRQGVLTREPDPLEVHYILDEAVLRRVVGGHDVMAEQLAHLLALAALPNVTLQVLAFSAGYYFDGKGEPVLLSFPWPDDPGVVYIESRVDAEVLESTAEVLDYCLVFEHLQRVALTPLESAAMIEDIAQEHQ